jgi:hypothetical protein
MNPTFRVSQEKEEIWTLRSPELRKGSKRRRKGNYFMGTVVVTVSIKMTTGFNV